MQQNKGMPLDLAFVVARVVLVALAGWQGRMKYGTVQEKPLAIGQASIYRRLLDIWHLIEMKVKWLQTNLYPLPVARIVGGQLGVGGRFMFGRCFSSWEFLLSRGWGGETARLSETS